MADSTGPNPRRPTMVDVAARAGVSRQLVSLVFRSQPGPSATARERVLQAAEELGYRPNNAARLLARNRSRVLGILARIGQPLQATIAEAAYPAAEELGYDVLLSAHLPTRDERTMVDALLGHPCEALLLIGPALRPETTRELIRRIPVVLVGSRPRGLAVDAVRTALGKGVRQIVDHLVELGHREIVHVDGGSGAGAADRRNAYRTAMRSHRLAEHTRVISGEYTEQAGVRAAEQLLREPTMPDAIFAANDRCAIGILDVLTRAGVRVPEDVSVVGYDDSPMAALAYVNLTTVRQDPLQLGRLAVRLAIQRLENPQGPPQEVVIQPTLVVRGTTGPRRPA
jgi:DNA-binding LacI/PurR family transcriptional regulator